MVSAFTIAGLFVLYWLVVGIYRLYFSPLANIPGPKIAALTSWYCAYHDIIRGGQYVWVVRDMHLRYGPVVRVRPDYVHVDDPAFIDRLYSQSPKQRRERADSVLNMFHTHKAMLPTRDHDLHRRRRAVLSRFFSKQNVRSLVPVINETLGDLRARMDGWAKAGEPVRLGAAFRAATKDVIQSYAFGDGDKCLEMEDLNAPFFDMLSTERLVHVCTHLHLISIVMVKLPKWAVTALNPGAAAFIVFIENLTAVIEKIRNAKDHPEGSNIFLEVLGSDIPASEKATPRLVDEAMVLAIAGSDTTASVLHALAYHVLADPAGIFARLRAELDAAISDPDQLPDPAALDGLPFLNALIEEALRMYPSATHRQDRVAPDEDLVFEYPDGRRSAVIPAGTPVGMTAPITNRNPAWYSDPDTFNPDRFLDNPALMRRNLTFSKGMRQCLGINLAYQELQTFTAGIFRKYGVYDPSKEKQDGPTMELYETTVRDVETHADYVTPGLYPGSKGLRVKIRQS